MRKILLIDKNKKLACKISDYLSSKQCIITCCHRGDEGKLLARNNSFDIIITSLELPGKSGLEIIKYLRTEKIQTPILILSKQTDISMIVNCLEAGADDFLAKPFNYRELRARCYRLINRPPRSNVVVLEHLGINLDDNDCRVSLRDRHIDLRKKEYEILKYFFKHPGRLITRSELLSNLWGIYRDPYISTIDVHISNIRKKLANINRANIIKTLHGRGYLLSES